MLSSRPGQRRRSGCCNFLGIAGDVDRAPRLAHPDRRADALELARRIGAEGALRRIDAVLAARTALEQNVKPQIAIEALCVALRLPA